MSDHTVQPTAADLFAAVRGGHGFTILVNQPLASKIGAGLHRVGWTPNHLTIANLVLGVATSLAVAASASTSFVLAGVIGLIGWPLAYTFDCADGQLARAIGQTSPTGAVLDLLVDYVVQSAVLLSIVWIARDEVDPDLGFALGAVLMAVWLINVFYSGVQDRLGNPAPDARRRRGVVAHAMEVPRGLLRDWGVQSIVLPALLLFGAVPALVGVVVLGVANAGFLSTKIVSFAR